MENNSRMAAGNSARNSSRNLSPPVVASSPIFARDAFPGATGPSAFAQDDGFLHPAALSIKFTALQHTRDVVARAGEIDVAAKGPFGHRCGGVVIGPTLGSAGTGVVFRKGENGRLFLKLPMLKSPVQITGAGLRGYRGVR